MTTEELKKALESDEGKKLLSSIVEDATKGLKDKNDELLGKLKDKDEDKKNLESRLDALESDKQKAEDDAATKSGDVEKIKANLEERHTRQMAEKDAEIEKLNGQLHTHVVGEGLTQALSKANVASNYMDAAKALIKSQYEGEIGDNDGKPFAKFDGKAVDEFVTDWAQSDAGKHFVTAGGNSGGSSNGASGKGKAGTGKTMTRESFDALSPAEKSKASIEGVTLTQE